MITALVILCATLFGIILVITGYYLGRLESETPNYTIGVDLPSIDGPNVDDYSTVPGVDDTTSWDFKEVLSEEERDAVLWAKEHDLLDDRDD